MADASEVYMRVSSEPPPATVFLEDGSYTFACPHCGVGLNVKQNEINCQIFRCGVLKDTKQPVPPHAPKQECERLVAEQKIWGCAKPFKFDGKTIAFCGYI